MIRTKLNIQYGPVRREDEAVDVLGVVQRVEMLPIIQVPEHRPGVLPAAAEHSTD